MMFLQLPTVSMFVTILISNRYKFDSRCNIHVLSIQVFSYVVLRCTTMQNKYEDKNVKIWINFNFVVVIPGKYLSTKLNSFVLWSVCCFMQFLNQSLLYAGLHWNIHIYILNSFNYYPYFLKKHYIFLHDVHVT